MAKTLTRDVDLAPIDRLEQKVRLLVDLIGQLRGEQTRLMDENARISGELDELRTRLAEAEDSGTELASLREERDVIRGRVAEMLEQLETLNL